MAQPKHPSWATLSAEERATYLQEARRRGGMARAQQESMVLARSKGFWNCLELHPMAWNWLGKKIRRHNQDKADEHNLSMQEYRFQRKRTLHFIYIRLSTGE